jgi:hypothetical protein
MAPLLVVQPAHRRTVPSTRAPDRQAEGYASGMPVLYRAVALGGAAVDRDVVPGVEVSQPHDLEEQEADRVAEVVMRSAERDQAAQPPARPATPAVADRLLTRRTGPTSHANSARISVP